MSKIAQNPFICRDVIWETKIIISNLYLVSDLHKPMSIQMYRFIQAHVCYTNARSMPASVNPQVFPFWGTLVMWLVLKLSNSQTLRL